MKKVTSKDLGPLNGGQIVGIVGEGVEFIFEHKEEIAAAFKKIGEFFRSLGGKNSPGGRLKRIEILEAQNQLQKEENTANNKIIASLLERIEALENK